MFVIIDVVMKNEMLFIYPDLVIVGIELVLMLM
jgi:hypothetical protein